MLPSFALKNWDVRSVLLFALLLWLLLATALHQAESGGVPVDFKTFYDGATRVMHHQSLYPPEKLTGGVLTQGVCGYLPSTFVLAVPLTILPPEKAFTVWTFMLMGALVISVGLYALLAGFSKDDWPGLALSAFVGFRFWPTTTNFWVGQVNLLMLPLFVGIFLCNKKRMFRTAGVLIGLAACIKYWALALCFFLLLRRKWSAIMCAGVTVAGIGTLQFAYLGMSDLHNFIETVKYIVPLVPRSVPINSLPGLGVLLFTANPWSSPLINSEFLRAAFTAVSVLTVASITFLLCRMPALSPLESRLRGSFALISLVLCLPICDLEYYVFSLPAIWTILCQPKAETVRLPAPALVSTLILYLLGMHWPFGECKGLGTLSFLYWALTLWGTVLLSCVYLRSRVAEHRADGSIPLELAERLSQPTESVQAASGSPRG